MSKTKPTSQKYNSDFPELPTFSAQWWPISIEPMLGSGERFTIGIAAKGSDGSVLVKRTLPNKTLKCISTNEVAERLSDVINLAIFSANHYLDNQISLDSWLPPTENIVVGRPRESLAENIENIIWQAINLTSFVSSNLQYEEYILHTNEHKRLAFKWKRNIKDAVANRNEKLLKLFDQKVSLTNGGFNKKIGFLYNNYAVNFAYVNNKDSKKYYDDLLEQIQAKLWVLDLLRAQVTSTVKVTEVELLINASHSENNSLVYDLVNEINEEAKSKEILVADIDSPIKAAEHLIFRAA